MTTYEWVQHCPSLRDWIVKNEALAPSHIVCHGLNAPPQPADIVIVECKRCGERAQLAVCAVPAWAEPHLRCGAGA